MKAYLWIIPLLLSAACTTRGDIVEPIQYEGQGSAIVFTNYFFITGNFEWDVTTSSVVPDTMVVSSSGGVLGTFTFTGVDEVLPNDYYFEFVGTYGDTLGLNPLCFPGACFPDPSSPFFVNEVVGCFTTVCIDDGLNGSYSDAVMSSGEQTNVETPEPPTVILLCGGLFGLLIASQTKNRRIFQ